MEGETPSKTELMDQLGATEKNIQNDIRSINRALDEAGMGQEVLYNRRHKVYCLENRTERTLSSSELLAVCKILLESRSLRKDDMLPLLDKLVDNCTPEANKKAVKRLIANEKQHYIEPYHGKRILNGLWEIGQAIQEHRVMEIQYERLKKPKPVSRLIEPVGIMFSEYYFYLTAFLRDVDRGTFENPDDLFPTIYRIDRIQSFRILDKRFHVPYSSRFEEGEFRRRVQFMYGGRLERIRFRYTGPSIEAVLDRLPTAKVIDQAEGCWTIEAEVFGKGIEMWLRSQGERVSVLTPRSAGESGTAETAKK